jgi:RNA-directed DNA polymerase
MRFDLWMMRTYPHIPFERYADKTIGHCKAQTRRGHYERTC